LADTAVADAGPLIVSSNIGCQNHLAGGAQVPVKHWIVALEEPLSRGDPGKS